MNGAVVWKVLGYLVPRAACPQFVDHSVQHRPKLNTMSVMRVPRILTSQYLLGDCPHVIGYPPDSWLRFPFPSRGRAIASCCRGYRSLSAYLLLEVPLVMSPLTIGWPEDLWGFVGTIDEVLIVTSTLDDQAIDAHFDGGVQRALTVRPKGKIATTWSRIKHDANARRLSEAP